MSDRPLIELPQSWKRIQVGSVVSDIQSGFASGKHNSLGRGVVHIRPMNISRTGQLVLDAVKYVEDKSDRRLVRGDVLFNNTNSPALIGKTIYIDSDIELAFSNHMTRLRIIEEKMNAKFLAIHLHAMCMNGYFEEICSNHVNQASVSSKRLESVDIVIPPLAEQEKIVEILEEQLSRLDAVLASVRTVREKAVQFRRSLLHAAFTGALTGHDTSTAGLPSEWKGSTLGEVARFLNGRAYKQDELLTSGMYRVVRVGNFFSNGKWYWSDLELDANKYCETGDLLYAWSASFGPRIWDGERVIFHYHIWKVLENPSYVQKMWLKYWLDNDVNRIKAAVGTGSIMMHITKSEMEKRVIAVPSLVEQEKIVEILEEQLSRLDASLAVVDAVEKRAAALRRSLLHAAFAGKLTEQWREGNHV